MLSHGADPLTVNEPSGGTASRVADPAGEGPALGCPATGNGSTPGAVLDQGPAGLVGVRAGEALANRAFLLRKAAMLACRLPLASEAAQLQIEISIRLQRHDLLRVWVKMFNYLAGSCFSTTDYGAPASCTLLFILQRVTSCLLF